MKVRAGAIAFLLGATLVAGCRDSSNGERTATVVATATSVTESIPEPEHLTFAAGQTIAADGKTGIFFLDPKTGAAEAWVVPENGSDAFGRLPFSFMVGGVAADGSIVVYRCQQPATSGLIPCGDNPQQVWFMLDTRTGSRTRLDAFTGDFVSISPNGKSLLGRTATGIALAEAARPGDIRSLALPISVSADPMYARADWSPDGARVVLVFGNQSRSTFLVDVDDASVIELDPSSTNVQWSPDGTRFTLGRPVDKSHSELVLLDRDAEEIWSKPIAASGVAGTWSGDGAYLYAQEEERPATADSGPLDRIIVLDATTGATAYRIRGAYCATGWAGKSHTLLASSYGFGEPVVDLDTRSLTLIEGYVIPAPFDERLAISFDGRDFYSYDLSTGETDLIARTTVSPAWDPAHEPLFVGNRLVFTSLHGGHGGCGEGNAPKDPPRPELLSGPFADDAPVTRGGVH